MMKYLIIFLNLIILTGCSNWKYKTIQYEKCVNLDDIHVHLYHHDSCEWHCLNMGKNQYMIEDSFRVKYKTNRKGEIIKVKLVK